MKTKLLSLIVALFAMGASAQTAKTVLDRTASNLSKSAATIAYTMKGGRGNGAGTITVQGQKYVLISDQAKTWFDGKTLWSIAGGSNEVNISTPGHKEIAQNNPMNFLTLYKKGYDAELQNKGNEYEVHLTAANAKFSIKEAFIVVDKNDYLPKSARLRIGNNWSTITVNSVTTGAKQNDAFFRFNAKQYPKIVVNDLR